MAVQENPISKCTEYTGHLLNLARTILEIPTGGQILLDGTSLMPCHCAALTLPLGSMGQSSSIACAGLRQPNCIMLHTALQMCPGPSLPITWGLLHVYVSSSTSPLILCRSHGTTSAALPLMQSYQLPEHAQ